MTRWQPMITAPKGINRRSVIARGLVAASDLEPAAEPDVWIGEASWTGDAWVAARSASLPPIKLTGWMPFPDYETGDIMLLDGAA